MDTTISNGPEETLQLGRQFAAELQAAEVVALCGDLGAGKTHFAKGVVAGLGGDPREVTSPTFTLVHEYAACQPKVFHFDFYRLEVQNELHNIGWDDYLRIDGVLLVEWAERFPNAFPQGTRFVHFEILPNEQRRLTFSTPQRPTA